jgi:hypothetical protein
MAINIAAKVLYSIRKCGKIRDEEHGSAFQLPGYAMGTVTNSLAAMG